jgi:hypothetical protein
MSYATNDTAAQNPDFQQRVRMAAYAWAESNMGTSASPQVKNLGGIFMSGALGGLDYPVYLLSLCRAVANDGATTNASTDADIDTRLASVLSATQWSF